MKAAARLLLLLGLFFPFTSLWAEEDGFLIVDVWVGKQNISRGAVVLYREGNVYLPSDFLSSVLRLPLRQNARGETEGWIYNENNRVRLLPGASSALVGKKAYTMDASDAVKVDGEWYYAAAFIGKIFDLTFEFDYSRQALNVRSGSNVLPQEEASAKASRRRAFDAQKGTDESLSSDPKVWRDDSFVQAPFLDLAARYHVSKTDGQDTEHFIGYSANAFAVTGGFDTEAYVYDMDNNSPATVALKTSRYQADGNMLGMFKRFEAGDILSFSNPAVNYAQYGRGFKLSTNADGDAESKTFNIRDALPLGWDVELYRGEELMGYQGAGADGFFEFRDVPLLLGENRFRLVFYGPQGQRREEVINYFFMGGLVDQGKLSLQTGFIEKNKYLIETRKDVPSYTQGYNGQLTAAYGVTDTLTLNAGALYDSVPILKTGGFEREDKFFGTVGAAYLWQGMFFNLQSVYDPQEGAVSADAYWQTVWNGWDLTAQNIYYDGLLSERNVLGDAHIQNDTVARVNKTLQWDSFSLPVNYAFRRFTTDAQQQQIEHTVGLYKTVYRNWYTALSYQHISGINGANSNLFHVDVNQAAAGYSLRADASYDFIYNHWRDMGGSVYKDLTERLNAGLSYRRQSLSDLGSDYDNRYGGSLNWKTKFGYWSVDAGWSDQKAYYAYIGFNLSFMYDKFAKTMHSSPDKLYGTGALSADVFMDANQNGVHDAGEESLPGASLTVTPAALDKEQTFTDDTGNALVKRMRAYQPYTAKLDVNKLDGSFALISADGPKTFEVRPGQVIRLTYPVLGTGDIEGTVYLKRPGKKAQPLRGAVVRLTDAKTGKTVASKVSEFDGYYLFEALPFGTYRLEVDARQMGEVGMIAPRGQILVIKKNEQVIVKDMTVSLGGRTRQKTSPKTSPSVHALRADTGAVNGLERKGEGV